ncbi:hypothetical protein P7C73_g1947, partial [Tremellales sp. Uapishka_1]
MPPFGPQPGSSSSSTASASTSNLDSHHHLFSSSPQLASDPSSPFSPISVREPPGPDLMAPQRPTLSSFRLSEGPAVRAAKLRALWESLPDLPDPCEGPSPTAKMKLPGQGTMEALSPERAERLRRLYEEELSKRLQEARPHASLWGGADDLEPEKKIQGQKVVWQDFRRFLWDQEKELWDIFQDLDANGDGRLDSDELKTALGRSGINITPTTVKDLVRFLASGSPMGKIAPQTRSPDDLYITFAEFRDFLIMLPRRPSVPEIYKFYQVRKRFGDGRGAARVDKEGDINVSFPKAPGGPEGSTASHWFGADSDPADNEDFGDTVDEPETQLEDRHEAWRFLLAGGVAGAVSRTVTAPFDRLKVYLITTTTATANVTHISPTHPIEVSKKAVGNLWGAVLRIYADGGGMKAFWVGNGLNVTKIFPESAIKFVSYEQSKRFLAKYWDKVSDPADISSSSRFISGGIGGITSQFSIYGLETLKTRVQSETGPAQGTKQIIQTARNMWKAGGIRTYYRGLTLGLVGVFPYSAIDMGTYETLKNTYCRSRGIDEPEVFAVLSFGALSGSIGAASVYPINLLRTRLQASGSSGHPQVYTGFMDVARQTLAREGWRGLYKGLLPSILKVGPAVGVSWIVYEDAKRRLGV